MAFIYADVRNFTKKLTIKRLWNAFKVLSSFYVARWIGKPIQWGMPITVSIEPTTSCNLRCPECPSGLRSFSRPTGMLQPDFLAQILPELQSTLLYIYFYFQGEPYLNPKFLDMVKMASEQRIYTVTSTNGHYLTDNNVQQTIASGLDRLIISVDGTTQETYQAYRVGGNLQKVLEGTKRLVAYKKQMKSATPHIIFQFLVVRPNEHQIEEVKALAQAIGVDEVVFKTAQVYDYENGNDLIPTLDRYSRYQKQPDGSFRVKNKMLNQCWKLWHACVITWDGSIVPCCFDKDASHPLGSLQHARFADVWQGSAYRKFRTKLLQSRQSIDICANCSEGIKVWA